jgi:hypothetical protein
MFNTHLCKFIIYYDWFVDSLAFAGQLIESVLAMVHVISHPKWGAYCG